MVDIVDIIEEALREGFKWDREKDEGNPYGGDIPEIAEKHGVLEVTIRYDMEYVEDTTSVKLSFVPFRKVANRVDVTYITSKKPSLEALQRAAKSLTDLGDASGEIIGGEIKMGIGYSSERTVFNYKILASLLLKKDYAQRYLGSENKNEPFRDVEVASYFWQVPWRLPNKPPLYHVQFVIKPNEFKIPEVKDATKILSGLYAEPLPNQRGYWNLIA